MLAQKYLAMLEHDAVNSAARQYISIQCHAGPLFTIVICEVSYANARGMQEN